MGSGAAPKTRIAVLQSIHKRWALGESGGLFSPQLSDRLRQRCAMGLNLPNRFNDVIHVPAVGQEQILGNGNRRRADLPVAFQFLEALAPGFQPRGAEETLESARIDRLVEQTVEILFVIAARTGDAFGVERFEELVAGQPVEMLRVVSEWIEMPDRPAV